jgi:hypothetical protein
LCDNDNRTSPSKTNAHSFHSARRSGKGGTFCNRSPIIESTGLIEGITRSVEFTQTINAKDFSVVSGTGTSAAIATVKIACEDPWISDKGADAGIDWHSRKLHRRTLRVE